MLDFPPLPLLQASMTAAEVIQRRRKPAHPPVIPAFSGEGQRLPGLAAISLAAGAVVSLYRTGVYPLPPQLHQDGWELTLAEDRPDRYPLHPLPLVMLLHLSIHQTLGAP